MANPYLNTKSYVANHQEEALPKLAVHLSDRMVDVVSRLVKTVMRNLSNDLASANIEQQQYFGYLLQQAKDVQTIFTMEYKDQLFKSWDLILKNESTQTTITGIDYPSLELEKNDALQKYHLDKLIERYRDINALELRMLAARIDVLVPFLVVTQNNNPFDPKIFMKAMRNTLQEVEMAPKGMVAFYQIFGQQTQSRISVIYEKLNYFLAEKGFLSNVSCSQPLVAVEDSESTHQASIGDLIARCTSTVKEIQLFKNISKHFKPNETKPEYIDSNNIIDNVADKFAQILECKHIPDEFKVQVARLHMPVVKQILGSATGSDFNAEINHCIDKLAGLLLVTKDLNDNASPACRQINIILKFFEGNLQRRKSIFKETASRIDYWEKHIALKQQELCH